MWRPNYEKKKTFITRWLEEKRLREGKVEDNQFQWKQVQKIEKSQNRLYPGQRDYLYIPKGAKTVYPKESSVEMRFSSTAVGTALVYIYAARKDDGIVDVAEGVIETGRQTITREGNICFCVDNINIKASWLSDMLLAQCRDGWSRVMFRTHGYNRFFVRLNFTEGIWYVDMVGAD